LPLDDEEHRAVVEYTSGGHRSINEHLREGSLATSEARNAIRLLDALLLRQRLAEEIIVFRGLGPEYAQSFRTLNLPVGTIIEDLGFMSTSRTMARARLFSCWPPGGLMLRIRVPAGTKALDLSTCSSFPDEDEVLFARSTKLRLLGLGSAPDVLEMEVVVD
jgi:hypothetical protein